MDKVFKSKYFKYKLKYLQLKNQLINNNGGAGGKEGKGGKSDKQKGDKGGRKGKGEQQNQLLINEKDYDLSIGSKNLINNSELQIFENTHYALVGSNGAGKSTLLNDIKRIADEKNISCELVKQETVFLSKLSIIDYILEVDKDSLDIIKNIEKYDKKMDSGEELTDAEFEDYENLISRQGDTENNSHKVKEMLYKLDVKYKNDDGTDILIDELSGGNFQKVSIIRSIINKPTILLIDEPTNHLDLCNILWLSKYLSTYENTLIISSHQIEFLNGFADYFMYIYKSIENQNQQKPNLYTFNVKKGDGIFSIDDLLDRKEQQDKDKDKDTDIDTEDKKGNKNNKSNESGNRRDNETKEAKEARKAREKKEENERKEKETREKQKKAREKEKEKEKEKADAKPKLIKFPEIEDIRQREVISFRNVSFTYPNSLNLLNPLKPLNPSKDILSNVDLQIMSNSKILIVGLNGTGKSTILKLINQELTPSNGDIIIPRNPTIGFCNQHMMDRMGNYIKANPSMNIIQFYESKLNYVKDTTVPEYTIDSREDRGEDSEGEDNDKEDINKKYTYDKLNLEIENISNEIKKMRGEYKEKNDKLVNITSKTNADKVKIKKALEEIKLELNNVDRSIEEVSKTLKIKEEVKNKIKKLEEITNKIKVEKDFGNKELTKVIKDIIKTVEKLVKELNVDGAIDKDPEKAQRYVNIINSKVKDVVKEIELELEQDKDKYQEKLKNELEILDNKIKENEQKKLSLGQVGHTEQIIKEKSIKPIIKPERGAISDQLIKKALGNVGISCREKDPKNICNIPLISLSGGQQSRVAFADFLLFEPSIILLDEPTNHLDFEAIDALITAINDFKGAVIIVSHDIYFMKRLEDFHIYELKNKNLNRIDDDVDNYLDKLEENMIKEEKEKMSNEEKEKIKKIEKMKNKKDKK